MGYQDLRGSGSDVGGRLNSVIQRRGDPWSKIYASKTRGHQPHVD